jgi:hypothetical protein
MEQWQYTGIGWDKERMMIWGTQKIGREHIHTVAFLNRRDVDGKEYRKFRYANVNGRYIILTSSNS